MTKPTEENKDHTGLEQPSSSYGIGDTTRMVEGRETTTLVVDSTSAHEILDVLLMTLKENPDRPDLWLMRFEVLRTLSLKADFAQAMKDGYASRTVRQHIDWDTVRRLWHELAPGEPPPEGVTLPKIATTPAAKGGKSVPTSTTRRFSDIALQVAEKELDELARDYQALRTKPDYFMDFARGTRQLLHRPTSLLRAEALERELGGNARIFLKREDLHLGTPETEIAVAQAHIAVSLGRQFIITGNDVDEFSLALAKVAPHFSLKLTVVVTPADFDQKSGLLAQLRDLGVQLEVMKDANQISQDPREGALRLWTRMRQTYHLALSFGSGPNPYPRMVSDFQMLLGCETDLQLRAQASSVHPRTLVAAVHSEADSIGFMLPFLKRPEVDLMYSESDLATQSNWKPSARLRAYNGAKREHAWLRGLGRITHVPIPDDQAQAAQEQVKNLENISISLEDARAAALASGLARGESGKRDIVVLVG